MLSSIQLNNVVAFEEFHNPLSFPMVTVIVGKNDCCKTALLKIVYAVGKARETFKKQSVHGNTNSFKEILSSKLQGVYGLQKRLGGIVRKNGTLKKLAVSMSFHCKETKESVSFSFGNDTKVNINDVQTSISEPDGIDENFIFIPAKEVVGAFNAIKAISRQYFFPGYDDTTLDLIDLLDVPERSKEGKEFADIINGVNGMFSGELRQTSDTERFRFYRKGNDFSMSMTAEGIKHIGILSTLIRNGQLHNGTVLLMDEPKDNLHPEALRALVKMLVKMSQSGVQIFLTTHSYFTLKQLEIEAKATDEDILCCSLSRNSNDVVVSAFSNLRDGMVDNDIVKASLEMYDEEIAAEFKK